jgi:serine/threonine-protein kinase RsbW
VVTDGDTAGEELRFRVPAVIERLHQLRRALVDWATRAGLTAEIVADLALAAYEAMANVVEHAYRGEHAGGLLDLHAHADPKLRTVTVTVTDFGRWRRPPQGPSSRGRGLALIQGLTQHTKISPSPEGTTVAMTYRMA